MPFKVTQNHQSKTRMRLPTSEQYWLTSCLAPFSSYRAVLVKLSSMTRVCLSLIHSFSVISVNIAIKCWKLDHCREQYGSIAATSLPLKCDTVSVITQNNDHPRRSRSYKITDCGTNWKPICDFLIVNNTNLHACTVSKLLRIIGQIFHFSQGYLSLTHSFEETLKLKNTKFGIKKLETSFCGKVWNLFPYLELRRRGSQVSRTDR